MNRALSGSLWLVFGIAASINLYFLIQNFRDSWDNTIPEGAEVYSILAPMGAKHNIYRDYTAPPYTATPYTPIFYLVSGWIAKQSGATVNAAYFAGRSVSLLCLGLSCWLVYLLALRTGAKRSSAALAALMALGIPFICPWSVSCRPDLMAICLSLTGALWFIRQSNQLKKNVVVDSHVLGVWLAAIFTKQTFFTAPLSAGIFLLTRRRTKQWFQFKFLFLASIGLIAALIQISTHGLFWKNVVVSNLTSPNWSGVSSLILKQFLARSGYIFVAGALGAISCLKRNFSYLPIYALVSTLFFSLECLKVGADVNYFLEPLFLWSAMAAHAFDLLSFQVHELGNKKRIGSVLAAVALLTWGALSIKATPPINQDTKTLDGLLKQYPGEVLYIGIGYGLKLGHGLYVLDGFNTAYLESYGKLSTELVAERVRRKEFSAIVAHQWFHQGNTLIPGGLIHPISANYCVVAFLPPINFVLIPRSNSVQFPSPKSHESKRAVLDFFKNPEISGKLESFDSC